MSAAASVLPRASPPDPAALAGSAAVQWLDSNSNVHIRNFHVGDSGVVIMSAYDGPRVEWTSVETTLFANKDTKDGIVAVNLRPDTPTHAIHLFFTVGTKKIMRSAVYEVPQNNWLNDDNFNNLALIGYTPRAAITWANNDQPYPSIRLYYVELVNTTAKAPLRYGCSLWEVEFENGWRVSNSGNPIYSFNQDGNEFGDSLAAVTWKTDSTRQIRVYYYDESVMGELSWSENSDWIRSQYWVPLLDEHNYRFPMAAVQWVGTNGKNQIRLYRHRARTFGKNKVREWAYDQTSEKWTEQDLPQAVITDTNGEAQISAVMWTRPDPSQVHIRLYQWKDSKRGAVIAESSFDTGSDWKANTALLGSSAAA